MLRPLTIGLLVAALAVTACSSSSAPEEAPTTTPTTVPLSTVPSDYLGFVRQPTACGADQPPLATDMKFDAPGDAEVGGVTTATIETSCGPIEIALDPSLAPETVNSFVFLAEAGDPTATGLGGPGYQLPDELPTSDAPYRRGVVAMANAGPNTAGSQFFILFDEADWLPPSYTVFGEVVDGFDTLDAIAGVRLGQGSASADPTPSTPLETVFIESITITR